MKSSIQRGVARAVVMVLGVLGFCPAAQAAPSRPNIIVILCDDMGFSDLGCYGSEIKTPNLDALAANGLRFTQFYNTARCCPTRASLLTGLYPHQTGVGHMTSPAAQKLDGYAGDLNARCLTIAQVLKPAGYASYAVGKWHVTSDDKPGSAKRNWPIQRGFDRYYGTIVGGGSFFDPGTLCRDNTLISPFADKEYQPPAGEPYYYTNAISSQAARFVTEHHERAADKPFFLYVAYTAAHWPMQALPRDIAKYHGVYDQGYEPVRRARFEKEKSLGLVDAKTQLSPPAGDWAAVKNKAWEARCMEVYAAMIDNMDQGVGRIVDSLKQTNQFDNTLILFLQDNGGNLEKVGRAGADTRAAGPTLPALDPGFIETKVHPQRTRDGWPVLHGEGVLPGPADTYIAYGKNWGNVSNTPFREYKHFVHEGGISTPLIAHWPQAITRRGELEKQPGHLIDVMATCVDLAGATYPRQSDGQAIVPLEGRSLQPAFAGRPLGRDVLYWEHEGNRAIRDRNWKLVAKGPRGKWELYDLDADRAEGHDLAAREPQRAAAMEAEWLAWAKRTNVLPWPWKPQFGTPPSTQRDQKDFALKQGDTLDSDDAPQIVEQSIRIESVVTRAADNGVIVAQGGTNAGYSLYVKDGYARFAVRRQKKLTVIAGKEKLPAAPFRLSASWRVDGTLSLSVNDTVIATGHAGGSLANMPVDGLQVGQDANGAVGEYETPFAFAGKIADATVRLGD